MEIVTGFLSTGGLPHQSADWFAMTDNSGRTAINTNLSAFRFCLAASIIVLRGRIFKREGKIRGGIDSSRGLAPWVFSIDRAHRPSSPGRRVRAMDFSSAFALSQGNDTPGAPAGGAARKGARPYARRHTPFGPGRAFFVTEAGIKMLRFFAKTLNEQIQKIDKAPL